MRIVCSALAHSLSHNCLLMILYVNFLPLNVCVSVFRISEKNVWTDFHETFHGSYGLYVDLNGIKFRKMSTLNV